MSAKRTWWGNVGTSACCADIPTSIPAVPQVSMKAFCAASPSVWQTLAIVSCTFDALSEPQMEDRSAGFFWVLEKKVRRQINGKTGYREMRT